MDNDFRFPPADATPPPPSAPHPEPDNRFSPPIKEKKSKGSGKALWIVLTILMTLVAGFFGWMYYDETSKTTDEVADTTTQTEDDNEAAVNAPIAYTAEVGKFELTLPTGYAVLERLDGPGEGGSATAIEVGKTDSENPGVIDVTEMFSLSASPEEGVTLANSDRIKALEEDESATRLDDTKIGGVDARVYKVDTLDTSVFVVFVNKDISYEITFTGTSLDNATYKAVADGFKFSE